MNIRNKKISASTAILLVALLAVSTVLGAITILYSLNIPATWNVRVATGLELDYSDGVKVTALSFTVDPLGTIIQSFILKNVGNSAVNVTDNIPDSTAFYTFTTTFLNSTSSSQNTIAKGGTYAFSITLNDLGMDSSQTYSGSFSYNIATSFPEGSSSFGTTTVSYASDSASYFQFVNDGFNSSTYPVGSTVLYHFTTENINQTMEIQGLSYKLEIYGANNNLVSTICDGLLVAYYQDAAHYELPDGSNFQGNGVHLTDAPLLPNQTMTIWQSFAAPTPGTYHLVLTYQSHNAAVAPPPITWTISAVNDANGINSGSDINYVDVTLTGATEANHPGTIAFTIFLRTSYIIVHFSFSVTIPQLGLTVASGSSMFSGQPRGSLAQYSYGFTPTANGALTMQIIITETYAG